MLTGTVFDIQRFCIHDGPGIRTTVFLKGCSLQCFWCHNPESINPNKELMFFSQKCISCGYCIEVCKQKAHTIVHGEHRLDRTLCHQCGDCAKNCEAKALVMSGLVMTVTQVMEEILKDVSFYKTSNGGVTFSGGEPLLQIDFLEEVLIACKEHNLHTTIETAGNVNWDNFKRISPYTDLYLYDLKVMDSKLHKQVVGTDNQRCLSNLEQLMKQKSNVRVRVPIIPDINDTQQAMEEIVSFVSSIDEKAEIELMPFHKMGQTKYQSLDINYQANNLEEPSEELMQTLRSNLSSQPH